MFYIGSVDYFHCFYKIIGFLIILNLKITGKIVNMRKYVCYEGCVFHTYIYLGVIRALFSHEKE